MTTEYIHVPERLDLADVDSIEASLRSTDPEHHLVLDFHDMRSFDTAALTRLAQDVARTKRPVVLRGLCEQHYRLLRYVTPTQH